MKVFAIFDSNGQAKGFYPDDVWPTAPNGSREITIQEWNSMVSFPQKYRLVNGKISEVSIPDEVIYPKIISDRQFFQQLSVSGIITQQEALAAVKSGDLPKAIVDIIKTLPADELFNAEMLLSGATTFQIDNPLTGIFVQTLGWTQNDLIQFWINASKL